MSPRIPFLILFLLLCTAATASEGASRNLADQLRRLPAHEVSVGSSLAFGSTSKGTLWGSLGLPRDSSTLRVLRSARRRGLTFGHGRLVQALERIAQRLVLDHSPSVPLWLGNMASRAGGRISFSRSHQTGLDADLVIPVLLQEGNSRAPSIRSVRAPREPVDERPVMDVAATWVLVEALLSEPQIDLLWIFLSDPLIDALLEHALEVHAPEWIVQRALYVLHQPSDSLPHDDHLHIRVACRAPDLLAGCRDSRPLWPWSRRTHESVDTLVLGDLKDALLGERDLEGALRAVLKTRTLSALPYAFVLMGDREPKVASLAARVVDSMHRAQILVAAQAGLLDQPHLKKVARRAMERCIGPLCGQWVAQRIHKSHGCKRGRSPDHQRWFDAVIREPHEDAAESLRLCVRELQGKLEMRALEALARVAGRSVPPGKPAVAADVLMKAISARPQRRFERLWKAYLPSTSWHNAAQRHLKSGVFGLGIDAMNRRELFERIWAYPRRSNLMPKRRRNRVWKNRLNAMAAESSPRSKSKPGGGAP